MGLFQHNKKPMAGGNMYASYSKKKPVTNTTHVMHLFEEKNKYPASPTNGPLPIKANGAIVVHRPSNHLQTIRSLPLYLWDPEEEDMYDFEEMADNNNNEELTVAQRQEGENGKTEPAFSDGEEDEDDDDDDDDDDNDDVVALVHQENNRLRQQILIEREQHDAWRRAKEQNELELLLAKQSIKHLRRTADRFEKLLLSSTSMASGGRSSSRRQSTGTFVCSDMSTVVSYERKLQILLNEIEAMEEDELESIKCATLQRHETEKLARKLSYKNDVIRQLAYDLQLERARRCP